MSMVTSKKIAPWRKRNRNLVIRTEETGANPGGADPEIVTTVLHKRKNHQKDIIERTIESVIKTVIETVTVIKRAKSAQKVRKDLVLEVGNINQEANIKI